MATSGNQKMVTAVFRDRTDGETVYSWPTARGYAANEINVLMAEHTKARYYSDTEDSPIGASSYAAEGMAAGGAVGTMIGAAAAAIAAIGTSVLIWPGYHRGRPLGGGSGRWRGRAVAGGFVGGLVGLGIPESNATAYEEALRDGGMAIGVVPQSSEDGNRIKEVFRQHHGENIVTA